MYILHVSYLSWQNKYSDLKRLNVKTVQLKLVLGTKVFKNLLLTKYLIFAPAFLRFLTFFLFFSFFFCNSAPYCYWTIKNKESASLIQNELKVIPQYSKCSYIKIFLFIFDINRHWKISLCHNAILITDTMSRS